MVWISSTALLARSNRGAELVLFLKNCQMAKKLHNVMYMPKSLHLALRLRADREDRSTRKIIERALAVYDWAVSEGFEIDNIVNEKDGVA